MIVVVSHTRHSFQFFQKGMGEVLNAEKLVRLLNQNQIQTSEVIDIYDLFGGKSAKRKINQLATVNDRLAWLGHSIIEDHPSRVAKQVYQKLIAIAGDASSLMVLTHDWNIIALLSTGIAKEVPMIAKAYVPPLGLKINGKAYEPTSLVVSECLLANLLGPLCGIPPWKMMYLPHHYPPEADKIYAMPEAEAKAKKALYLKKLGCQSSIDPVVVGLSSRFKEGKHIEHVLEVFERCHHEGLNAVLVLKGGYDDVFLGSASYKRRINKVLERVSSQPWFLWDREFTPFPDVLNIFRLFDLCVLVSGTEGGSNSVAEFLSLGRPCLLLKENTNPYLFNGAVEWVQPTEQYKYGRTFCYVPDKEDLYLKLKELIQNKSQRDNLGSKARDAAFQRFSVERTLERIPLMLEAAKSFHGQHENSSLYQMRIIDLLREDMQRYQIPLDITIEDIFKSQLPEVAQDSNYSQLMISEPLFKWY